MKPQVQKAQIISKFYTNLYKSKICKHVIFKLQQIKYKLKILNDAKAKNKKNQNKTLQEQKKLDFFSEIMQAGEWNVLKENYHQPRIMYPGNFFFRSKGEINTYRQTNIEEICHQQTYFARNVKKKCSGRRKRNLNEMSFRKTVSEGKIKIVFILFN